jgi:hypothetical protein
VDADIAFFGVLRAVEGFDTHKDVLANTTLGPWCESRGQPRQVGCSDADLQMCTHISRYSRMQGMVGTPSRITA